MRFLTVTICLLVGLLFVTVTQAEWPRFNVKPQTGGLLTFTPKVTVKGAGGLNLITYRKWDGGLNFSPDTWGLIVGRQIWFLPVTGNFHIGLPYGDKKPIWFGLQFGFSW